MKSESQIRHKLKQVLYRHLQKKIRGLFRPSGCIYNVSGMFQEQTVGMCNYGNRGKHIIVCDSRVEGCNQQAVDCSWFKPAQSKEDVKASFKELAGDLSKRGQLAFEYPDVAALMWVLEDIGDLDECLNFDGSDPLTLEREVSSDESFPSGPPL